jgi:hypothetical protein
MRVLIDWVSALTRTFGGLTSLRDGDRGMSKRLRRAATSRCVPINEPAFVHPDPLIYSQSYLMSLGLAVTWDNPDIQLYRHGAAVSSSLLEPDTDYEIVARIWNNSAEAPILGLPVTFSVLSFGIGMKNEPIGQTGVNLGVKGGPDHPAFARMKWRTPREGGHYCLQVLLEWLDDSNPANNLGQENTTVAKLHSPAQFKFPVRNETTERQVYRLEVDTYAIPELLPCSEPNRDWDWEARHRRGTHPIPRGWSIRMDPSELLLQPGEEQTITVDVDAPDGFRGRQSFNVNAFDDHNRLAGGVTLNVESQ